MNPRKLNQLINILKGKEVRDQQTGEDVVKFEPYHRKMPAEKLDVSGGQTTRGQQVEESVSSVFNIRYIKDIDSKMQVEDEDGKKYSIVTIRDLDGKREWLQIQASTTE